VPTIAESGLAGYEVSFWTGVVVPAGASKEVVVKLNREIVRILNMPEVQDKMVERGLEPMSSTPEEFAATIRDDIARYGKVIKDVGLKVD
jgi:tripartite-type tricarboxylate transporter receptor subunit TctC